MAVPAPEAVPTTPAKAGCGSSRMPWQRSSAHTISASMLLPQASSSPNVSLTKDLSRRRAPYRKSPVRQYVGWACQRTWAKRRSSWPVMSHRISMAQPSCLMAAPWQCGETRLALPSYLAHKEGGLFMDYREPCPCVPSSAMTAHLIFKYGYQRPDKDNK